VPDRGRRVHREAAAARISGLSFFTNDLDKARVAHHYGDATDVVTWQMMLQQCGQAPDWVIDNPPFSLELPIAQHALAYAQKGTVLMSRLSFVEGTKTGAYPRGEWLQAHPRQLQIALERYSFTGDGTATRPLPNGWSGARPSFRMSEAIPRSGTRVRSGSHDRRQHRTVAQG
jgi:hypothetical protein